MDPLTNINSVLPEARRVAIRKLIGDLVGSGEVSRTNDAMLELDKLTAEISNIDTKSIMQIRKAIANSPISSNDWNDTQKEMFVDLRSLYEEIKLVNSLSSKHSEISQSELRRSKAAIIKAINDIRQYQFLKQFPEYQDIKFVDFSDSRSTATRQPLASPDTQTRKLELAHKTRDRLQQQNLDLRSTEVSFKMLGGGISGGFDESFSPEDMLDDDPDTFWAELILTDGMAHHKYVPSGDSGLGATFVSKGVLAEITLNLSNTQRVNNITLLPFGAYPVRIVDLAYKESPYSRSWITIPTFSVGDPSLDWYEWSFKPIHCAVLRVTLEQVNFTTNISHIPENLMHNNVLWSQILNQVYDESIHNINIDDITYGKIIAQPEQLIYLNALKEVDEELRKFAFTLDKSADEYHIVTDLIKASGRILTKVAPNAINDALVPLGDSEDPDTNNIVEIRKNEYIVGIKTISLSNILYQPVSYYDSPKFTSGATILETSIESTEEHPSYSDGFTEYNKTSVEYELEIGQNLRFPLLPANYETITGAGVVAGYKVPDEYIPISRTSRFGNTRFSPQSEQVVVRRNGERVNTTDYTFTTDSGTDKGKLSISSNYDANAIYTVSYIAQPGSAIVDIESKFNSTKLISPDISTGTNRNNAVKLSYFPYIDYKIVNDTGSWIRDDENDASWRFSPTLQNYKDGTISINSGETIVTGFGTDFTGNVSTGASFTNVFRTQTGDVSYSATMLSATGIQLSTTYEGPNFSGEYQVGESFESDGNTYALNAIIYEPVKVFVNDIKAFNLTDYRSLEHPAFIPDERFGRQYQYVHSGGILYFNKPIQNSKIEMTYSWLTQYVQVKVTLRCNIPIKTDVTPKIDDFTVRIKNSKL